RLRDTGLELTRMHSSEATIARVAAPGSRVELHEKKRPGLLLAVAVHVELMAALLHNGHREREACLRELRFGRSQWIRHTERRGAEHLATLFAAAVEKEFDAV